ncbi:TRAP transporter substrate-binding protein [Breoghania sp. L-A4]|uniref:TRAP transporter substrate-binding protein n=1 Tax=Breoghania sp. L-A4 TaxID=2304600 RepID=UPI000E35F38A|nr:TRAP transporter substrate-binding protein [Breoghania sp. L-A4]AXS41253.1 TRAP transporter substrate-binding protein [Breoghania sp. L-A4]
MTETSDKGLPGAAISRRNVLLAGATGVAAAGLAAPAIAQSGDEQPVIEWKMVTSWPKNLPGPGVTAQRIADNIGLLSGGRMRVRLYAAGELVPALEVFDAVSSGTAQLGHSASFFWQGKMPAAAFFTAVPFGLTPLEHMMWIEQGGGQEVWDTLYAPFGVKPFMGGNTGFQMGGWFNKEINTLDDIEGLKIRMPGLGGEVMRKLGATPVSLPPSEILTALQTGVIDAAEFLGPWSDLAMGFHKATKLYYGPGFHEPNGTGEALVNGNAFEGLPEDLKAIVEHVFRAENALALSESEWMNAGQLLELTDTYGVTVKSYPDVVLKAARMAADEVLATFAEKDPASQAVYESFKAARERIAPWSKISQQAFLSARG